MKPSRIVCRNFLVVNPEAGLTIQVSASFGLQSVDCISILAAELISVQKRPVVAAIAACVGFSWLFFVGKIIIAKREHSVACQLHLD